MRDRLVAEVLRERDLRQQRFCDPGEDGVIGALCARARALELVTRAPQLERFERLAPELQLDQRRLCFVAHLVRELVGLLVQGAGSRAINLRERDLTEDGDRNSL